MRISARNQLKGKIVDVTEGAVNGIVAISIGDAVIKADITNEAIHDLELSVGRDAIAIIKASSVMFAPEKIVSISARNQLAGTIVDIQEGAVNGHITIKLPSGDTIKGSITNEAIQQLGCRVGEGIIAIVKATEVMVGIE